LFSDFKPRAQARPDFPEQNFFETNRAPAGLWNWNMKRFSAGANVNPAFKMAQPLPRLPGDPTCAGGKALPPGCANKLKNRAATKLRPDCGQSLVSTALLHAAAAPGLSQALFR
jgi:hypothetical protein